MKLTVLGYWGGYPSSQGGASSYLLEDKGFNLIIDLGSGGLMVYQKYKSLLELDAVIISHFHADHISDIGVLQHGLIVQSLLHEKNLQIPIYAHSFDQKEFARLTDKHTTGKHYHPNETLKIGPFQIKFMRTIHAVPCFAMRISNGEKTITYTADSAFQKEFIPFAQDSDLLIAETSLYDGQDGSLSGHMTSKEVGGLAQEANVAELFLTHLPHYGSHEKLLAETKAHYQGHAVLAKEGLVWQG